MGKFMERLIFASQLCDRSQSGVGEELRWSLGINSVGVMITGMDDKIQFTEQLGYYLIDTSEPNPITDAMRRLTKQFDRFYSNQQLLADNKKSGAWV